MNNLSREKQIEVITALCEGVGIRTAARLTGFNRGTVASLALPVNGKAPLEQGFQLTIKETVESLEKDGYDCDTDSLVAERNFGFWVNLLGKPHDSSLWRQVIGVGIARATIALADNLALLNEFSTARIDSLLIGIIPAKDECREFILGPPGL